MKLSAYLRDFTALLFPELCQSCNDLLQHGEEVICSSCRYKLPYARFHHEPGNPIEQVFWGRVPIESATSLFYFSKGSKVQNLIHNLKYRKHHYIGPFLGEMLAHKIKNIPRFQEYDFLCPVPLHPKKQRLRGFNQAMAFAEGLSSVVHVPAKELLLRKQYSSTQTKKGRYDRFKNMSGIFQVKKGLDIKDKKVLLTDDILTTGSTLEACATPLVDAGARVSLLTMAMVQ